MHQATNTPATVADDILKDLTIRQFLHPHDSVYDVIERSAKTLGFCPRAAAHAMRWLQVDPRSSIGRLRRTELTQLARSVHRFWQHAAALPLRNSAI